MKFYRNLRMVNGLLAAACLLVAPGMALADVASFADEKVATETTTEIGYRGFSLHGEPGRAAEFQSLNPGPLFRGKVFADQGYYHFDLGLKYLNDDDFSGEAHLDTKGMFRLDLRSDRFVHNLDHIPYANGSYGHPVSRTGDRPTGGASVDGSRPDDKFMYQQWQSNNATPPVYSISDRARQVYYNDHNVADDYALRLGINEVKAKIKCPDYPAHLTLSYWRYDKEGDRQQNFLDHGDAADDTNCTGCHMQSKTREVNLVTEEFKVGTDAHAGVLDMVIEALYRKFSDQDSTPTDNFRFPSNGTYPHDEYPDSTLKELTLKLNTAPAGGLVGSTSFTIGKRENRSNLGSENPVDAEVDYNKIAADVTYTPDQNWTFSLRYRRLDMDTDNSDYLTRVGYVTRTDFAHATTTTNDDPVAVRDSMDITRNWYEGLVNYRPWKWLTLKGEVRFEDIDRSNTGEAAGEWNLPDSEEVSRVRLGFNSRFLAKSVLKVSGWVAYQHDNDPAYGITPEDSSEFYLTGSYTPSAVWGVTTSLNLLHEKRDDREVLQADTSVSPEVDVAYDDMSRKRDQQNFMLGSWFAPVDGLSFDINYGYLRTSIDQDLLFGTQPGITTRENDVEFRQTVHTVSLGATWQALKNLVCRVEGYHIRSKGYYDPEFADRVVNYPSSTPSRQDPAVYPPIDNFGIASSAGLRDFSEVDIIQNGLKGRLDWKLNDNLTCGLEATFDDYDEKGNDIYDGSAQSYMASLTYTF